MISVNYCHMTGITEGTRLNRKKILKKMEEPFIHHRTIAAVLKFQDAVQKRVLKKKLAAILTVVIALSTVTAAFPAARLPLSAETVGAYVMDVFLNEYALNVQDSNYYAWRGTVNITGEISQSQITESQITAYLDDSLTPFFSVTTDQMTLQDGKYSFAASVDTTDYQTGYHRLRVYDGTVASFSGTTKTPVWSAPVYFEYAEFATVYNVSSYCNMRASATTASAIVTPVNLNEPVEVLSQVKGEYRSDYGTDLWYQVRYIKNSTVYNGYIVSALLEKMKTGISKMKVTASNTVIEEFLPGKTDYVLNLPHSASALNVKDIAMYNKTDNLKVKLNGVEVSSPYTSLPLLTGNNTVEFIATSGTGTPVTTKTYKFTIWRIAESTEAEFQAQLAKFPKSYQTELRTIHTKYPNWLFVVQDTNLVWNDVIDTESAGTISLISKYNAAEYKESSVIQDGTEFVLASRAAVEYYIDPRNFLNEKTIFQFEQLSYNANIHTLAGITKLISGCGVAPFASSFLSAGQISKVSPYHLAARSRQEVSVGTGLSVIATGNYAGADGKYLGYYNFYNIGTGSSTNTDLLMQRGLGFAMGLNSSGVMKSAADLAKYNLPWDSAAKAIVGGGIYIGENYINKGQDTLYLQKFDVDPIDGLYYHQYMQNIQAPYSESSGTYNAYSQMNALGSNFIFKIPVYRDMPLLTSPKPEDTNKLNSLAVDGYTLFPVFDASSDTAYTLTVPAEITKITLTASSLNSNAVIAGTGSKNLVYGTENIFVVSCTPVNGEKREYTIHVTRNYPEKSSNNLLASLAVSGPTAIALTPAYNPDYTGPYSAEVPDTTASVTLGAVPQNSAASVSGTGTVPLNFGDNLFALTVTAENGSVRTYQIKLSRRIPKATSTSYIISNGSIRGIPLSTTALNFKKGVNASVATVKIYDSAGKECPDSTILGTGMTVKTFYGTTLLETHVILIYGDTNGDGKVNSTDISMFKRHILKSALLTGKYLEACDLNKDGKYNSTDYSIMKRHILKLQVIKQQ